jgi:hypothetical protein
MFRKGFTVRGLSVPLTNLIMEFDLYFVDVEAGDEIMVVTVADKSTLLFHHQNQTHTEHLRDSYSGSDRGSDSESDNGSD